jgi:hypothetical protein
MNVRRECGSGVVEPGIWRQICTARDDRRNLINMLKELNGRLSSLNGTHSLPFPNSYFAQAHSFHDEHAGRNAMNKLFHSSAKKAPPPVFFWLVGQQPPFINYECSMETNSYFKILKYIFDD